MNARLSEKDWNLYNIREVPFAEVRSIGRHTPACGWQYIIVVLSSGLAFPPLYFYNRGVREFLATVKHVCLVRSGEDANVFLVNDFQNPLLLCMMLINLFASQGSFHCRCINTCFGWGVCFTCKWRTDVGFHDGTASIPQYNGRQKQNVHDPARDISIQVLDKFSIGTKLPKKQLHSYSGRLIPMVLVLLKGETITSLPLIIVTNHLTIMRKFLFKALFLQILFSLTNSHHWGESPDNHYWGWKSG